MCDSENDDDNNIDVVVVMAVVMVWYHCGTSSTKDTRRCFHFIFAPVGFTFHKLETLCDLNCECILYYV